MKYLKLSSDQLNQLLESNSRFEDYLHNRKHQNQDSESEQNECDERLKENRELRDLLYKCKLNK